MSTATFAQQKVCKGDLTSVKPAAALERTTAAIVKKSDAKMKKSPARSAETGLYYYKPEGSMYSVEFEGVNSYIQTFVLVPAWEDTYTYKNMSTNPASTTWMTYNSSTYEFEDEMAGDTDITISYLDPGYGFYTPMLKDASGMNYYTMDYYYLDAEYGGYEGMLYASYDMDQMGFFNNKSWYIYGAMDNDNMAGSGTVTYENEKYTVSTVGQLYPAPASPLYVESIDVLGNVINGPCMANGAELTMNIYNTDTGELMETLTAGNDDYTEGQQMTRGTTLISVGMLNFTKKVEDPLFGTMEEPITIDYPSTVIISGFENPDIDFGVSAFDKNDCDDMSYLPEDEPGDIFFDCIGSTDEVELRYEEIALNVLFNGMMDKVIVSDEVVWGDDYDGTGYSVIQISDDGQTCDTYGMEDDSYHNLGALFVQTVREWYDEDANENYYYDVYETTDEDNDWIVGVNVDTEAYDEGYGYYLVSFEAEPLPSGMEGRSAILYFKGSGYTDSTPVVLIQGNADMPDGINSVLAPAGTAKTSGTYSVTGQRVSSNAKGIIIKDGKKYLNK